MINHDTSVLVAINPSGLYVIDPVNVVILLGLKFEGKNSCPFKLGTNIFSTFAL